jgi:hypothetical protein
MHALFEQVWFDPQQAVPHGVVPPAQLELQLLLLQTWLAPQAFTQLPQWDASDATHWPLQSSRPVGHWHWPSWQLRPPLQAVPQVPQLF